MTITQAPLSIREVCGVAKGQILLRKSRCEGRRADGFAYILSGEAEYTFSDGRRVRARTGDVLFLARGSRYGITLYGEEDYTFIFVDFVFACEGEQAPENALYSHPSLGKTKRDFEKALALYHTHTAESLLLCASLVYRIYAALVSAESAPYLSGDARRLVEEGTARIAREYADPALTVAALARDAGVSEVYYRRLFGAMYGTSPVRFLTAYRLSVAKELLSGTELPVGRIAEMCGFASSYYFARVFKKEMGVTPLEYRRRGNMKREE